MHSADVHNFNPDQDLPLPPLDPNKPSSLDKVHDKIPASSGHPADSGDS